MDGNVTQLLNRWRDGDRAALDRVVECLHTELHELCARAMARERGSHTLQPTALLSELYLRLENVKSFTKPWETRREFLGFAVLHIRRALVSHARRVGAEIRGGNYIRITLDANLALAVPSEVALLDFDRALEALAEVDPRMVMVVDLTVFAGMTQDEIAEELGVARSTVQRDWKVAKRYLARALTEGADHSSSMTSGEVRCAD